MNKDFDKWGQLKKSIESKGDVYVKTRDIWWCSLGVNVGSESCGKNDLFERPVLVIKTINKNRFLGIPLTTKNKNRGHLSIHVNKKVIFVITDQLRTLSTKRLSRKICKVPQNEFSLILLDVSTMFKPSTSTKTKGPHNRDLSRNWNKTSTVS